MATLGGRHRQRGTGRLLTYWAAFGVDGSTAVYSAALHDRDRFLDAPDVQVSFDPADMTGEEAVRQDIGRYIDSVAALEASSVGAKAAKSAHAAQSEPDPTAH